MTRLRHFMNLPRSEQRLALRATRLLAMCRIRLRLHDVSHLKAWAMRSGDGSHTVADLTTAVRRAIHLLPKSTCLARAITLQHLLSESCHASELKIGVWKSGNKFASHAWLVDAGGILIGDGPEVAQARVLDVWRATGHTSSNATAAGELG